MIFQETICEINIDLHPSTDGALMQIYDGSRVFMLQLNLGRQEIVTLIADLHKAIAMPDAKPDTAPVSIM